MAEARANNKKGEGGDGKYRKIKDNEYRGNKARKNTYFVMYDLYIIGDKKNMKSKPAFKAFDEYYYLWNYERLSATVDIGEEFPKEFIRKRILKKTGVSMDTAFGETEQINPEFTKIIKIVKHDEEFAEHMEHLENQEYGLDGIKILSVEMMNKSGKKFDILAEKFKRFI